MPAGCEQQVRVEETEPAEAPAGEADGSPVPVEPGTPGTPVTPAPPADDQNPDPAFTGSMEEVSADADSRSLAVLEELRTARRDGHERIVFEFRGCRSSVTCGRRATITAA